MKKALVIGGGGFVGSAVARQLLARGVEVAVAGRNRYRALAGQGIRILQGDIRDREFLVQACRGFDTVFHTAAKAGIWGEKQEYEAINVTGTENVLHGCRVNDINVLVYTSTPSVVFDGRGIRGGDESLPHARRFLCHYAATKAKAENLVVAANTPGLRTCALRPHLIWGPGDPHLVPRLVDRGRRGLLKRVGEGTNLVDISYVDNVADAHVLAAANLHTTASAAGRAYFISQGEPVKLWEWVDDLFARLDIPPVTGRVTFRAAKAAGLLLEGVHSLFARGREPRMTRFLAEQLARSHWFSIEAARRDLGYEPRVTTEQGMERLVAWLKRGK